MLRRDGDSSGIEKEGKQTSLRAGCRHGRKRGGQPPFFIFLRRPSGTSLDDAKTSSMPWVSRRGDRWFAESAPTPCSTSLLKIPGAPVFRGVIVIRALRPTEVAV